MYRTSEFGILFKLCHGFGKDHVGPSLNAGLRAVDGRLHTFHSQRISASHDDEAFIRARIHRSLDPVNHFTLTDNGFVGTVTTTFLHHLIFDVESCRAGLCNFARSSGDIEGAAPTGVDIYQQGQVAGRRDTARILAHVMQRGDTQIGNAQRRGCHASAGQVQRFVPAFLRKNGAVGGDGANHL